MQLSYYVFNDLGEVLAIFTSEELAIDYLEHMFMDTNNCKKGYVADNVFRFEEHDAKYHTMEDSSLHQKKHIECKRFKKINTTNDMGYCFFTDEFVDGIEQACNMIKEKK